MTDKSKYSTDYGLKQALDKSAMDGIIRTVNIVVPTGINGPVQSLYVWLRIATKPGCGHRAKWACVRGKLAGWEGRRMELPPNHLRGIDAAAIRQGIAVPGLTDILSL